MALIKTLREQSAIGFNGKIVIQDKDQARHLGQVFICAGTIVGCNFENESGKKSLLNLLIKEFSKNCGLIYVVEPEVIPLELIQFEIELTSLETEFREVLEKTEKNRSLRPPDHKRLIINSDFICRGSRIEPLEFDIMCLISDFGKIGDIYAYSDFHEYEVTNALVSLRKKGALKVLS